MLEKLKDIFDSNIKAFEILYLLEDVKPVVRLMVKEEDKDKIFAFFKGNNLSYVVSDFKVVKEDKDKAYSDKGVKVPIDSSEPGYFFVYVSKDKDKAEGAKKLENEGNHKGLGEVLGYPSCCSEFFEKHFEEESKKNNDFTLAVLRESDGFKFPFYTNIASRHFDVTLLNHFPCSFNCEASVELAKRYLDVVKKHDKESAEVMEGMLKGGVVYTETQGVFLLRYPELDHNGLDYELVMGSNNSQLYGMLKGAEYIEIVNKNKVILNGMEIKNIGIMLFS